MGTATKILLTIGSRGQVTIPAKIRKKWKSKILTLEFNNESQAILSPVKEVAGLLAEFKIDTNLSFNEIREHAWHDSIKPKV